MMLFDDPDEHDSGDDLGIGRPGPEDPALMTARQLIAACTEARNSDDLGYAASETEAFIEAQGDDVEVAVLVELLALPSRETLMQALIDLADTFARRGPPVVPALFRRARGRAPQARVNAEMVLSRLRPPDLAAGLVLILQDETAARPIKEEAALSLLGVARSAPAVVFDALAEPEVRTWLIKVSGCPPQASDSDLMRSFFAGTT